VIKQKLDAKEAFTNELIDDINKFDAAEVTAMAQAYKAQSYKAQSYKAQSYKAQSYKAK
jgi:hypothetical protein